MVSQMSVKWISDPPVAELNSSAEYNQGAACKVFSSTALPGSACDGMMDQLPGQKCRE